MSSSIAQSDLIAAPHRSAARPLPEIGVDAILISQPENRALSQRLHRLCRHCC